MTSNTRRPQWDLQRKRLELNQCDEDCTAEHCGCCECPTDRQSDRTQKYLTCLNPDGSVSMVHHTWQLKNRVSIPGGSKILFFSQKCADQALASIQSATKWVPGVTSPLAKRTINYFTHMPLEIQGGDTINPLNPELNPICYLLALLGAHHFLHVSRIRVKSLTIRRLMLYIYIYIWSTHSWCF